MNNSILLIGLCFIFSCKQISKNKEVAPKQQRKIQDYSGVYLNCKQKTIEYKLIKISSIYYYFEIFDTDKTNPAYNKRKILGQLDLKNDTFKIVNTSAALDNFITIVNEKGNIIIDSLQFHMYDEFHDIRGTYIKVQSKSKDQAAFAMFRGNKWDEGEFIIDSRFKLYEYPSLMSNFKEIEIRKNDWASTYIDVYNNDSSRLDFAYILIKNDEKILDGWMYVSDYYTILKRIFKCEREKNGIIEKWNKEKRYTLFLNSNGNLIRKESDSN